MTEPGRQGDWSVRGLTVSLDRPVVAGVLNVTPDSFSDGGQFDDPGRAGDHAREMVADGAGIIDVGAQSTRPGAPPIDADVEWGRLRPILAVLRDLPVPISIDTTSADVAERALDAGAVAINDVSAGRADAGMARLAARTGAGLVLMHMRGTPRTMQDNTRYDDVVRDVVQFLVEARRIAVVAGCSPEQIALDPGLGFGKSTAGSLRLLAGLSELAATGAPIWIGPSRKSFLGDLLGRDPDGRMEGTIAACIAALEGGARVFRVHDVGPVCRALSVSWAVRASGRRFDGQVEVAEPTRTEAVEAR